MEVQNELTEPATGAAAETSPFVANVKEFCRGEDVHGGPTRTPQSHEEVDVGQPGDRTFLAVLPTSLNPACRAEWVSIIVDQILRQHSFFVVHKLKRVRNTVVFQCDNRPVGHISRHDAKYKQKSESRKWLVRVLGVSIGVCHDG